MSFIPKAIHYEGPIEDFGPQIGECRVRFDRLEAFRLFVRALIHGTVTARIREIEVDIPAPRGDSEVENDPA